MSGTVILLKLIAETVVFGIVAIVVTIAIAVVCYKPEGPDDSLPPRKPPES